ncbi:hypothetical protein N3K63_09730 [Microbacterium sp. W1N]|uniref:hypothetical protein n=1 Tax=Microbacterium festucae TaxID=2977531 RepID=UPI0021C127B8|nr:hypothetical protein [Microbacterium festucae]MCT9820561.1 hypothetical protein [Microbacterium festucae]
MGVFDSADVKARKRKERYSMQAQERWDAGDRYFAPSMVNPGLPDMGGGSVMNNTVWVEALEAIESVGWVLHTWSTAVVRPALGPTSIPASIAQPLFVRHAVERRD